MVFLICIPAGETPPLPSQFNELLIQGRGFTKHACPWARSSASVLLVFSDLNGHLRLFDAAPHLRLNPDYRN